MCVRERECVRECGVCECGVREREQCVILH